MPVRITVLSATSYRSWRARRPGDAIEVVPMTADALLCADIGRDANARRLRIADDLQRSIQDSADALREWYTAEAETRDPVLWWGSQHASRSISATPAPLTIALALVAQRLLRRTPPAAHTVFVVDSTALATVIATAAREAGYVTDEPGRWRRHLRLRLLALRPALAAARFLLSALARWTAVRLARLPQPAHGSRIVLVRSWCTSDNLQPDGRYTDRNFGALSERLQAQGRAVWINPCFFRLAAPFREMLRRARRSPQRFLIAEGLVGLPDLFAQALRGWREGHFRSADMAIAGCRVGPLMRESVLRAAATRDLMGYNLLHAALARLRARGVTVERLYYPMENNAFEKLPLVAMRRHHPTGETIGFQHSAWFAGQPSMRITAVERDRHPVPDTILCNGRRYPAILAACGFPMERTAPSPSFRFLYALAGPTPVAADPSGILLLPGFDANHANDTLLRLLEAFAGAVLPLPLYVKPHPTSDLATLQRLAAQFPDVDCRFVSGAVNEWVDRAHAVVESGGSVAALETMLRGRPVIRSVPSASYFLDPFWDAYPIPKVHDAEELARAIRDVLAGRYPAAAFEAVARAVREGYFAPDDGGVPPSSAYFVARS